MAKGFRKEGLDLIFWELQRGFGRRAGYRAEKAVFKELGKRVVDPSSKFRKQMQRLTLPGTLKGAVSKMYTMIDAFREEYLNTKAMLQGSWYIQDDVKIIEQKLEYIERLVFDDAEERAYARLLLTWEVVKKEALSKV